MASKEFNVVAVLYPKKGKADRVIELLQDVSTYVKSNEPGTLRYSVNRSLKPAKDGTEDIIMIERYKDMKALQAHGSSEKFTTFQKQMEKEDLIRAPMLLKMVAEQGGFSARL